VRNLKTGRTIERTWKSGDTVEAADVVDTDMQYLYSDGDFFHFMVPRTSSSDCLEDGGGRGRPMAEGRHDVRHHALERCAAAGHAPAHMELKVVETDPGLRGDTATGGSKPAKLETGLR